MATAIGAPVLWLPRGYADAVIRPVRMPTSFGYVAKAVAFDGSTRLTRGAALTGAADSGDFAISVWIKITAGDGTERAIVRELGGSVYLYVQTTNKPRLGTGSFISSNPALAAGSGWHHLAFSAKASPATTLCYIDGVDAKNFGGNATTVFTAANWGIGAQHDNGANPFTGSMSDLWMSQSEFVDFSNSTTLQKFRSAGGKPVNLGANGSTPTGNQPILFLSGDATDFATNKGTGGGMSVTAGALTTDSSGPSA